MFDVNACERRQDSETGTLKSYARCEVQSMPLFNFSLLPVLSVRDQASVVEATAAAARLDVAAPFLAFEASLFRAQRRPGRPARLGALHRRAQEFCQTLDRVGAVALLGAEALRLDHDHPFLGHAAARKPSKARSRVGRQRDAARIEAQLCRRGDLVDVLPAGTRG